MICTFTFFALLPTAQQERREGEEVAEWAAQLQAVAARRQEAAASEAALKRL